MDSVQILGVLVLAVCAVLFCVSEIAQRRSQQQRMWDATLRRTTTKIAGNKTETTT